MLLACAETASPLPGELSAELRPGMPLAEVSVRLKARNTTYSVKDPAACQAWMEKNGNRSQLAPRGGSCLFGKIPIDRSVLGTRRDVILQVVFDPDEKLADGHFEEIRSID